MADDDLTYSHQATSDERQFFHVSDADLYPKPVPHRGPRPLTGIERVCGVYAWFVCAFLVFAAGYYTFEALWAGRTPSFVVLVTLALGLVGALLMVCLHDERKMRK